MGNCQTNSERKPDPKEVRKVTEHQHCLRALPVLEKVPGNLNFDSAASGVRVQKSSYLPENSTKRPIVKYFNDEIKLIQTLPENRKRKHSPTPLVRLAYP